MKAAIIGSFLYLFVSVVILIAKFVIKIVCHENRIYKAVIFCISIKFL